MAFFMVDDQLPQKGKIKSLTAPVLLTGDITGLAAIGMWTLAGAATQAAGTDGLVHLADLVSAVPDRMIAEQLAHHLVDAGLLHAPGHDCPRCDPVPEYSWRFHDWWDMRYKRAADLKVAQAKSKENKRPEIVNAVWLRDCVDPGAPVRTMTAHCRYCGTLTKRSDHSTNGPQLDHVDPRIAAGVRNLVVACGPCNRTKGSRTPQDAGMTLRPAPTRPGMAATDAETTVSPVAPALAAAVSPVNAPVAETPAEQPYTPADHEPTGVPLAQSQQKASPESPPAGATRGRGRERASGSGSGSGLGSGEGSGSAQPAPRRPRRRGRGGRPRADQTVARQPDPHDAGPAPLAWPAPSGASPWKGWTGPASSVADENRCPIHTDRHVPCPRCARDRGETR